MKIGTEGIMGQGGLFITTGTPIQDKWAEHANTGDMFAENAEGLDKTAIAKISPRTLGRAASPRSWPVS